MIVHKYTRMVYDETADLFHGEGRTQIMLYIPEEGIIGYRSKNRVDFFSNDPELMSEAQKLVEKKGEDYIREIDLPKDIVLIMLESGKARNIADEVFQKHALPLVDLSKD